MWPLLIGLFSVPSSGHNCNGLYFQWVGNPSSLLHSSYQLVRVGN